jgi:hypothetical protein
LRVFVLLADVVRPGVGDDGSGIAASGSG